MCGWLHFYRELPVSSKVVRPPISRARLDPISSANTLELRGGNQPSDEPHFRRTQTRCAVPLLRKGISRLIHCYRQARFHDKTLPVFCFFGLFSIPRRRVWQCPMCRAACHGGAGGCGTNLAMVSIIKSQFGAQYEDRRKEVHSCNVNIA